MKSLFPTSLDIMSSTMTSENCMLSVPLPRLRAVSEFKRNAHRPVLSSSLLDMISFTLITSLVDNVLILYGESTC